MPDSPTTLSLHQLAELVPLTVLAPAQIATLGFLPDRLPLMLTFLEDRCHLAAMLANSSVAAVITSPELADTIPEHLGVMIAEEPRRRFFELQNAVVEQTRLYGEETEPIIHATALIHPRADIASHCVSIGAGVRIQSGAVIGPGTVLGAGVVVQAGAVLGASGFQTYRGPDGFIEMAHAGNLEIGDGTMILAKAVLARGVFRQSTRIGRHCRIGANSFISHNVGIGDASFVGHGAIVNGNCRVGCQTWIGPGAVLSNGIEIQDRAKISLGAVVIGNVAAGIRVSGNFAVPHQQLLRHLAATDKSQ